MTFYNPQQRPHKDVLPGMRIRTFWGEGHLLSLVDLDADTFLPRHSHPHEQSSFVLSGELEFEIDGEKQLVRAGELIIIPGGVEHQARVGPEPAQVLDIFVPIREEFKY